MGAGEDKLKKLSDDLHFTGVEKQVHRESYKRYTK